MSEATLDFATAASEVQLQAVAERLRGRNFEVVIVDTGDEAKAEAVARVPEGSEVHTAKSKTLEDIGLFSHFKDSGKYDFLRLRLYKMDRATQADEMRRLVAAPDYMLGSVQAVTEAGQMLVASASGSQMGPYSAAARQIIIIVGSQKIVPDLEAGLRRITDYVEPYEDRRLQEQMGVHTALCRVLIMERDYMPGKTTVILVREPVGM